MVTALRTSKTKRREHSAQARSVLPIAARRHPLVNVVERQLLACGVLKPHSRRAVKAVIGVSGGADSVALLLACTIIANRKPAGRSPLRLTAVHVHHHLRRSAFTDAAFVRGMCRSLGVPCTIEHVRPARLDGNLSANARSLRYAAMCRQARRNQARFVLAAHHADDQFETILMAFCRGAGLDALAGMAMVRPLEHRIDLVRPLLCSTKMDCEDLCRTARVGWREDPTNRDVTKARARLRNKVIPVLEELWPGSAKRTTNSAMLLRDAAAIIGRLSHDAFGPSARTRWPRARLGELPAAVLATGLRSCSLRLNSAIADDLGLDHLSDAVEAIRSGDRRPKRFDWPGGLRLSINAKLVSISKVPRVPRQSRRLKATSR